MSEITSRYSQSDEVGDLVAALAKAKLNYGEVSKSKVNKYTGSVYADLQDLMTAAERPLAEQNIVVIHFPIEKIEEKKAGAFTKLVHASGQYFANEFLMPATGKASGGAEKLDAQTVTGGVTYAKRCNYGALAGLVGEADEDGNELADRSADKAADVAKPKTVKAPPVSQKVSSQGGERPQDSKPTPNKPAEVPAVAPAASQTNDPSPTESSVVPKAAIPADTTLTQLSLTPAESTSSQTEQPDKKADTGPKPTKTQFDAYTNRAILLKVPLEKAGLKPSKGIQTGAKLKNYLLASTGVKELADLTIAQWEEFFTENEQAIAAGEAEQIIAKIEGGK